MVFASLEFLFLFLPVFLLVYVLAPKAWRNAVLMLSSWCFYALWSPMHLSMLVGLTLLSWGGGLVLGRSATHPRTARAILTAFVAFNLGLLCWCKYANIIVANFNELLGQVGATPLAWQRVILPIGLSFIVLQAISYLVDVYRGTVKPTRNFIDFAAHMAMFGQLIAGPIIRYAWVDKELLERNLTWPQFSTGARRFMIGMCMKVLVADTLSPLVGAAFALPHPTFVDAWLGCLAYSLQLFFDFAGYSAMAIGLGLMLGFHFPENFDNPFLARSIQDFWRRWYLSLSTWIRDYLYIPLGGSRNGEVRTSLNLLLTMALAGLWYGSASWNFLLWGLAHGMAQCVQRMWGRCGLPALPALLAHGVTLLFVCQAWVLFRAPTWGTVEGLYAAEFGMHGWALGDAMRLELRPVQGVAAALAVAAIVWPRLYPQSVLAKQRWATGADQLWPLLGFALAMALIAGRGAVPFLYFQF